MNSMTKCLFALILTLFLFTACAQPQPAPVTTTQPPDTTEKSTAIVKLVPDKANAPVGETITVSIIVENVKDLYGVELHLSYDADTWEVLDEDPQKEGLQILPGNFPNPDFIALNEAEPQAGSISYAAVQLPPTEAVSGKGTVASLRFKVKANDKNPLSVKQALLANQDGTPIPINTESF